MQKHEYLFDTYINNCMLWVTELKNGDFTKDTENVVKYSKHQ